MARNNTPGDLTSAPKPLVPSWVFGFNSSIPNGAHSLVDKRRDAIFYPAAHIGVIFDFRSDKQYLLLGHCNHITACAVSRDKRWIVTTDKGEDSMIVIWDSISRSPVKTIFNPHPYGVSAIDLSPDATRIATLSYQPPEVEDPQIIAVWEWTVDRDTPIAAAELPTSEPHFHVAFNPSNISELVTNGEERVVFWAVEELSKEDPDENAKEDSDDIAEMSFFAPPVSSKQLGSTIAPFTVTTFLADTTYAVSGTKAGDAVLWDTQPMSLQEGKTYEKQAMKLVRLTKDEGSSIPGFEEAQQVAIEVFTTCGTHLVCGTEDGSVRVFDYKLRLIAWYEDINAGPITSISFSKDDTASPEQLPDFIVGTRRGLIVGMEASAFSSLSVLDRQGTVLVQSADGAVTAIAVQPQMNVPHVIIASQKGALQLWDYEEKALLMVRILDTSVHVPERCAFDPAGNTIALCTSRGEILFLDSEHLHDVQEPLRVGNDPISHISFSPDGKYLAVADKARYVAICEYTQTTIDNSQAQGKKQWELKEGEEQQTRTVYQWTYIGRARTHNAPISGLNFDCTEEGEQLLASVGKDRRMVQYNVDESTPERGVQLRGPRVKVEQSAIPTACLWYPSSKSTSSKGRDTSTGKTSSRAGDVEDKKETDGGEEEEAEESTEKGDREEAARAAARRERMVITANDEYKFKLWNAETRTCRRTVLSPTYGGPIARMAVLRNANEDKYSGDDTRPQFLVYRTTEKVVGVIMLPLDGNPHKSMGIVAHPGSVEELAAGTDGRHMLTAGGDDCTVILWEVDTLAMEQLAAAGGEGLNPFLNMLEGGAEGKLYQDMCDFFAYAQIRSAGEDSTAPRRAGITLPLDELPNLVRALGYYPTEEETEALLNEVRYGNFAEEGKTVEEVDLGTVVKLFVNHRPVLGESKAEIADALQFLRDRAERRPPQDLVDEDEDAPQQDNPDDEDRYPPENINTAVSWKYLQECLQNEGEQMSSAEIARALNTLTGGKVPNVIGSERMAHSILNFERGEEE
eukprot:gb/GECG01012739.1/.p1 GENE.gb/GECG01012739.1/~~gb/GECG01012739.1/.p1  ORF type:complete len:1026 (+),score=133.98 gb/GECG01012739.1/:1-3078(+)